MKVILGHLGLFGIYLDVFFQASGCEISGVVHLAYDKEEIDWWDSWEVGGWIWGFLQLFSLWKL